MNSYILDACALLALLQDESGAERVAAAIVAANNGEAEIVMNKISLLEVYYDVYRFRGKEQAKLMVANLAKHRVEINAEITDTHNAPPDVVQRGIAGNGIRSRRHAGVGGVVNLLLKTDNSQASVL